MTIAYPNIADRLFGRAHAIEPVAMRAIIDGPLGQRVLAGERLEIHAKKKDRARMARRATYASVETESVRSNDGMTNYALTREGVALISMDGVLSKRFDWLAAACGFTTYEGLSATLGAAMADYRVKAILFDVDSPGGQVDGCLEMAEQILAAREKKPIWAVANSLAASAAYALAGSAEKLYLPQLAQVGSIGAVMLHIDQSAQDAARGLKYSAIYSGARKIDGWEHAALSPAAREAAQARVDHCRAALCDLVGRQGRLGTKAALATEARVYSDIDAIDAKLADGIKTFADALVALTAQVSANSFNANTGASAMTNANKDQLLTGASAAALTAGQQAVAAEASAKPEAAAEVPAAPVAAAAAAVEANLPNPPAPGEKCITCGQVMPNDDDDDGMPPDPDGHHHGGYTLAVVDKVHELCAIAKVPAAKAREFIKARMPLQKVRAELAKMAADATDAQPVDGTARPSTQAEENVAAAWDDVVAKINAKESSKR